MFESCYTPTDVAHLMRFRYHLPAILAAGRPAVQCDVRIGAVDMPVHLGAQVLGLLGGRHSVPVVTNPRDTVWTFLVASHPDRALDAQRAHRLSDYGVTVRRPGQRVLLPMSDNGFGGRWASKPTPGRLPLPPRSTVLDAIGALLDEAAADSMPQGQGCAATGS
ncbi:hypothetical protein ABIA39_003289 [Nocardia sp. GAS34]|jgi:hypothetical protein|uniref:hypothetical protein n=1 Tax=unclassified Nocardia TaxID=2637762 RepID=UPI003D23B4C2